MAAKRLPFNIDVSGRTAVVIAGGPSLTAEDCDHASQSGAFLIGVNDAYRIAELDVLYASDHGWIEHHHEKIKHGKHLVLTQQHQTSKPPKDDVYWIRGNHGHDMTSKELNFGGNSGFAAVHLASIWNADRILLLGFDMTATNGKRHWFGNHPGVLHREAGFASWITNFERANCPTPIINCSRESALKCYPRSTITDEL